MSVEVADLVASLRASDEGFSHSMDVAGHAVEGLHKNTDSAIGSIKALGLGLGAVSLGALAGAVKAASDFSTMMVHLQSNTGVTTVELGNMSAGIKALAASSGAPLNQLSEGIMRIHNSGFSAADALKILKPAMESALSTGDDVGKVAAALGVAMHEFHINTDQATQSMNLLHTAAQLGNSTLGEFADGTTKALNLAGGFGLSLVDVAAALSTLTQSGQTARNASDGLSAAMSGFVKPTAGAMEAVQNLSRETGINLAADFSAAGLKSRGLANAIDDVKLVINKMGGETALQRKTMEDYATQLTATGNISDANFTAKMTKMAASIHDPTASLLQLFPNIRAFREMMLLTGSQSDSFAKNLGTLSDVMSGKLDPTTQGFAAQQATLAAQMAKLQVNVQILAINLGTILLPPLTALVSQVTPIVQQFSDWAGKNQQLVIGVLAAGVAIGGLTVAAIGLGAAVEVATGPIGLLAAAGAGLYLAWQHNIGGIQGIVANMWNQVKPVLQEMQAAFQAGGVSGLAGKIQSSLAGIDWAGLGQTIATNVQQWGRALVGWIQPQIPGIVAALGSLANAVVTYIRAAAPVIEGQMLAWGHAVWSWIQQATPRVVAQLQTWGAALVAWVQPQIGPLVATLGGLLSRLGSWIVGDAAPVVIRKLEQWGSAFIAWVSPKIQPLLNEAGRLLSQLGTWITGPAATAVETHLKDWGGKLVAWIGPHIQPMLHSAGDLLNQFGTWITGPAANAIGTKLGEWGSKFIAWVVPAMKQFLNDWPHHLNDFLTQIHNDAETIAKRLGAWAGAFVNWIVANDVPRKLLDAFVAVNAALIYFIGSSVAVIAENLGMWALEFWGWLDPADTFAKLKPSLDLLWASVTGWVATTANAAKTALLDMGKNTVQGFIDGIKAKAGDLKKAAEGIPHAVIDATKGLLHIGSPSKVMHQYGVDVVQGFANGLIENAQLAWDAAKTVADGTIFTWGQTFAAGVPTMIQMVKDAWAAVGVASLTAGNTKLGEGELQTPLDKYSAQGSITAVGSSDEIRSGIVAAHTVAVAAATPSIQSAYAGLTKAATAATAAAFGQGTPAVVAAVQGMVGAATQAGQQLGSNFATIAADAAQRLKNLATTGNINGVVAGQQAQVTSPYDAAGVQASITPPIHNAASQASGQLQQVIAGSQGALQLTTGISGQMANIVARLTHWNTLLPDILKGLTDAKTMTDLTTAGQAAKADLVTKEEAARAQNNVALLAELQGQQSALTAQQAIEASLIRQVNSAQTLADNAQKTLTADQARLSTLQQQEDAADQALNTAQQNLQTVQETLKTQQDQLNLRMAYDPSHMQQQANVDAMALANAQQKQSLDQQIQAAQAAHNTKLVTELNNQKSILDTNYQDQRAVIEAQMQQTTNAYQTQQQHLQDIQQQESINNQLKKAQDQVVAAAKKDVETEAAVKAQQSVVQQATIAANKATQAWKDAIAQRTEEDNTATLRAKDNETKLQNLVTDGYNIQIKQIADLSNKYAALNVVKAGGTAAGAATGAAGAASSAGVGGAAAGPSVNLAQAITDATAKYPKQMHDFGQLFSTNIAAGLAQGLGEDAAIQQAIYNLNQGLQNKFVTDWQMHSPSKVAESYGRNIVAGLVGGIRASQADAHAVLGGLFSGPGGGGGAAGASGGDVHVTVNVQGGTVSVEGADHHGLGAALGDVARAFLASAKTTAPGSNRLAPGAARTVPI